ncbi:MAG: CHRD domain-containing protein, partial [Candidatus Nitrotoga sp.]
MNIILNKTRSVFYMGSLTVGVLIGGIGLASADAMTTTLSGNEEVPAVSTSASGVGKTEVALDRSIRGSITTTGIDGTAAHVHEAPAGKNGPVIITLKKASENVWEIPSGASLSEAQYANYKAGDLYLNVHSKANSDGEIRGQLSNLNDGLASAAAITTTLSGDEEVPAVSTSASGVGKTEVALDRSIRGSITTTGIDGTAAHVHEAPSGKNGPPIITLKKTSANVWEIPSGASLTEA